MNSMFHRFFFLLAAFVLFSGQSMAQAPTNMPAQGAPGSTSTGDLLNAQAYGPRAHKTLGGTVYSINNVPIAGAQVEISNTSGAAFQVQTTGKDGFFIADFSFLDPDAVHHFVATLKITKKGYQVAHKIAEMNGDVNSLNLTIRLRPIEPEIPSLLSRADLVNYLAPKLRQLGPFDGLSPKQAKDYARGAQDFLDRHRLDDAVPRLAKVAMTDPKCLKCRTMLALALLDWGDLDDPRNELTDAVNTSIKDRSLGSFEPLLVYGVLWSWERDPARAIPWFQEALKYSPHDPLTLQELGRAESMDMNWWAANESFQKALAAGAGPDARLMHAEALVWVGTPAEAAAEMDRYLNGRNPRDLPPRARSIYERVQLGKKEEQIKTVAKAKAAARGVEPIDYLHHPPKIGPEFEAAPDQKALPAILDAVGQNVAELFQYLPNICSTEKVDQMKLEKNGKTGSSQTHTFRYLLSMPSKELGPSVEEYRANAKGNLESQTGLEASYMLTEGFVSAPLVFHPTYQPGSSFRLLGAQNLNGKKTYVIAYAQDPVKSRLSGTFQYGAIVRSTFTQGVAWVDAENYQITRIISDLVEPLPQLRLDKETTDIAFSGVHFKTGSRTFWLPETVTVTLGWNGMMLRNNHAYSDFLLTNVESTQKIGKPKGADKPSEQSIVPASDTNPHGNAAAPARGSGPSDP